MRELIISSNDEGQRLNKFLMKYMSGSTSSFIYKMLRKKNIVLNDKKASGNEILVANDSVKLYLSEETIEKFSKKIEKNDNNNIVIDSKLINQIKLLYKDEDILALHKPAGLLSQKAKIEDYSINEYIIDFCLNENIVDKEMIKTFKPSVCNRLDRNTSGIILAGITLKGSQKLSAALKSRNLDKFYLTIVKGVMKKNIRSSGFLYKENDSNISKVIEKDEYESLSNKEKNTYSFIDTEFIPLSYNNNYTLLKVKIFTGKSHQIRAHLKSMGYSVIGDKKYGHDKTNQYLERRYKLCHHLLHSYELRIPKNFLGTQHDIVIYDDIPNIFMDICKGENIPWQPGKQED